MVPIMYIYIHSDSVFLLKVVFFVRGLMVFRLGIRDIDK